MIVRPLKHCGLIALRIETDFDAWILACRYAQVRVRVNVRVMVRVRVRVRVRRTGEG